MQAHSQPIQEFQGKDTVQKMPAGIPAGVQGQCGRPSGLSFEDVRVHYASGREQRPSHMIRQEQVPAAAKLQAMPGQGVVQLWDPSLTPINYLGVDHTTLGRTASRMAAANRNLANRRRRAPFPNRRRLLFPGRGRYSHSEILRAALVRDARVMDPIQSGITNQAHHIVETSNRYGQLLLNRYGIDPDSAVNGVLLPTHETADTGNTSIHLGSHSAAYTAEINAALNKAVADARAAAPRGQQRRIQERAAVIRKLQDIRTVLLTENVPLNGSSDPTFDPVTASGETISDIFRRTGLT